MWIIQTSRVAKTTSNWYIYHLLLVCHMVMVHRWLQLTCSWKMVKSPIIRAKRTYTSVWGTEKLNVLFSMYNFRQNMLSLPFQLKCKIVLYLELIHISITVERYHFYYILFSFCDTACSAVSLSFIHILKRNKKAIKIADIMTLTHKQKLKTIRNDKTPW